MRGKQAVVALRDTVSLSTYAITNHRLNAIQDSFYKRLDDKPRKANWVDITETVTENAIGGIGSLSSNETHPGNSFGPHFYHCDTGNAS